MYFGRAHHLDSGQNLPVHLILKVSNFDHPPRDSGERVDLLISSHQAFFRWPHRPHRL